MHKGVDGVMTDGLYVYKLGVVDKGLTGYEQSVLLEEIGRCLQFHSARGRRSKIYIYSSSYKGVDKNVLHVCSIPLIFCR